jgi:hypothetical protein
MHMPMRFTRGLGILEAMREKLLWSLLALLGLIFVASNAQTSARPELQIGRYQIVVTQPSSSEAAQAFRLDTVTGRAWIKALDGTEIRWSNSMREPTAGR